MPREGTAGFAKSFGLVEAVGINEAHALAGHVVGMLPLFLRGVIAVMAVGVSDSEVGSKSASARRVESLQASRRIAQHTVELAAKIVVDETHARVPVTTVSRGLTQVLAKEHGIIAGSFLVKDGVSVVGIAEATGAVELGLNSAKVTGVAGILVCARLLAEKVVGHVFDGIEPEAVGLRTIHQPTSGPDQVSSDVFSESLFLGIDVLLRLGGELGAGGAGAEFRSGLVDEDSEISGISILVLVVLFGAGEIPNERKFRMGRAFACPVVCIRSLVGDIDQVGKSEILHLPGRSPISAVVPLAVEAVLRFS